jgi:hypothetical protein
MWVENWTGFVEERAGEIISIRERASVSFRLAGTGNNWPNLDGHMPTVPVIEDLEQVFNAFLASGQARETDDILQIWGIGRGRAITFDTRRFVAETTNYTNFVVEDSGLANRQNQGRIRTTDDWSTVRFRRVDTTTQTPSIRPVFDNPVDIWTIFAAYRDAGFATYHEDTRQLHIWGVHRGTTIHFNPNEFSISTTHGSFRRLDDGRYQATMDDAVMVLLRAPS